MTVAMRASAAIGMSFRSIPFPVPLGELAAPRLSSVTAVKHRVTTLKVKSSPGKPVEEAPPASAWFVVQHRVEQPGGTVPLPHAVAGDDHLVVVRLLVGAG